MHRSVVVAAALLIAGGCQIENNLGNELPEWPSGNAPPIDDVVKTDVLLQVTTPQVDVLWMIDNSCSMSNEQTDLTANFPAFMDYFLGSGLDYQIGITSSDTISSDYPGSSGTLVVKNGLKWIEPDTPNPIQQFQIMATLGTTGRYPERGIGATYHCLETHINTVNYGFMRDDAAMHTIAISDESDYTEDFVITQPEFVNWYDGLKPERDQRSFSAIIDPNDNSRYPDSARALDGIVWDLNQENWPEVLDRLGLQVAGFKREYFLSQVPVDGTIEVSVETREGAVFTFDEAVFDVEGNLLEGDWTYDSIRNSITFIEFVPDELSKVRITYTLLGASEGVID